LKHSIQPFLSQILDYAGLYPPASLPLNDAFGEYIKHYQSNEFWMLSKFVAGTNYLSDLVELINAYEESPKPFLITAVAAQSVSLQGFKQVVVATKKTITNAVNKSSKEIRVPSLEIKLPENLFKAADTTELQEAIEYAVNEMTSSPILPYEIFFEISGFAFEQTNIDLIVDMLSNHLAVLASKDLEYFSNIGFKIRCGGVEAFQFPPIDYLAHAIHSSVQKKIPLKFTAGLHHPVRHYNSTVSTKMHGFLNVFGATLLCHHKGLSKAEVRNMLEDENPNNFIFSDAQFIWKDYSIASDEIQLLRSHYVTSFGSCSFDEPVEDLQELTLLT
tara:strand:- start:8597 stop:9589 length:993 start_codon:yes stop_codon:yes gene_type:complete